MQSRSKVSKWPLNSKLGLLVAILMVLAGGLTAVSCTTSGAVPRGWSGTIISDGNLFIGSMEGKLVEIDSTNHTRKSAFTFTAPRTASTFGCSSAPPPVAVYGTPVIRGDLVYATAYSGEIHAINFNLPTPADRWVYPRQGQLSPFVGGLAVGPNAVYTGGSDGRLYALDATTGDKLWEFPTGDKIWSTPTVDGDTVYVGSFDKKLYALKASDGAKKWEFPAEGAIAATPVVYRDKVYFGSFDRYLYAVSIVDGSLKWKFQAKNWFWSKPVVLNDVVYAASLDGNVYGLNAETGAGVVEFNLGARLSSSPVAVGNTVIIATEPGQVYSLDTVSKQKKQLVDLKEMVYAALNVDNGAIYVHTEKDNLYALDANSGTTLWSLSLK